MMREKINISRTITIKCKSYLRRFILLKAPRYSSELAPILLDQSYALIVCLACMQALQRIWWAVEQNWGSAQHRTIQTLIYYSISVFESFGVGLNPSSAQPLTKYAAGLACMRGTR